MNMDLYEKQIKTQKWNFWPLNCPAMEWGQHWKTGDTGLGFSKRSFCVWSWEIERVVVREPLSCKVLWSHHTEIVFPKLSGFYLPALHPPSYCWIYSEFNYLCVVNAVLAVLKFHSHESAVRFFSTSVGTWERILRNCLEQASMFIEFILQL